MKRLILSILIISSLTGCVSKEEVQDQTARAKIHDDKALFDPELVGNTYDGQKVFRVKIENVPPGCDGCSIGHPHWVYFVGSTLSVNQEVPSGRTSSNEVTVVINGKPVSIVEAKTQIDKLLMDKQEADLKKLRELQAKYGAQK